MAFKDEGVEGNVKGVEFLLKKNKIDAFHATGRIAAPGKVEVTDVAGKAQTVETKAIVTMDDRRYVLDGPVAVLGRSREADCVFSDPNVSRQHAELRRGSTGDWQIVDLGSTNGIKVNDRRVDRSRLSPGDEVTLGTTRFVFDIEQ